MVINVICSLITLNRSEISEPCNIYWIYNKVKETRHHG
jgi:hypothetical protein